MKKIETLRAASRKHTTDQLKEIALLLTNQISSALSINSNARLDDARSVRAAAIDVIIERLGEDAGDKFMTELGL